MLGDDDPVAYDRREQRVPGVCQVDDVHFAQLDSTDVVRHKLVSQIVDAYAQYDDEQQLARGPQRTPGRRDDAKRSR